MILVNTGIPKSGTSLLFDYQRALLRKRHPENGLAAAAENFPNCFVAAFDDPTIETLLGLHRDHGPFAIKTHAAPIAALKPLIADGPIRVTCMGRDPRDVVLSALDHAARERAKNLDQPAFAHLDTFEAAAHETHQWVTIHHAWRASGDAIMIRYEDLTADPATVLCRLSTALDLGITTATINRIVARKTGGKRRVWNFNKGLADRWRTEFSPDDLATCREILGLDIAAMGYPA